MLQDSISAKEYETLMMDRVDEIPERQLRALREIERKNAGGEGI